MPTLDEMTKTRKVPNSLEQMSQSSPAPRSIYDNIKDPNEAAKLAEEVVDLSHKFGLPPGVVEDDYPLLSSFPDPQVFGTSRTKMVVPPPRTFTIDGKTYTYGPQAAPSPSLPW